MMKKSLLNFILFHYSKKKSDLLKVTGIVSLLFFLIFFCSNVYAQRPYVSKSAKFAVSVPVRDLPPLNSVGKSVKKNKDKEEINELNEERIREIDPNAHQTPDAALSSYADLFGRNEKTTQLPNPPSVSFDGISFAETQAIGQGYLPPDVNGEVGPNHFVQSVNVAFRVYNKSGTPLTPVATLKSLFSPLGNVGTQDDGDPIVLYDQLADRWIISQFVISLANPNNHQVIAVSKTGDPTGAYYLYDFMLPNTKINDYPKFGMWPDGYYMTSNQFNQAGSSYQGAGYFAFDRAKMLVGDPTASYIYFDSCPANSNCNIGGVLPADLDGFRPPSAGAPCPFVFIQANEFGDPADQLRIFDFHADFTVPSNSTFTERTGSPLVVASFDPTTPAGRDDIPQPPPATSTAKLDAIVDRLMFRLSYRNDGTSESLIANHTVNADVTPSFRAAVRIYQLKRTSPSAAFSIVEQQTFAGSSGDLENRWMGSGAINHQGDIALGYSVSSSTVFPSIRYAAKLGTDAAGSGLAQGEQNIITGGGSQTSSSSRWGDYTCLTVDPSDDCTFWYTGEYYSVSGTGAWKTRIAKFAPGTVTISPRGSITGTITNCVTGLPISNAYIQITGGYSRPADASGFYNTIVVPGTYTVIVSAPGGYNTATQSGVVVLDGGNVTVNLCLAPTPIINVSGSSIQSESCLPANAVLDPNETVTVSLCVQNTGGLNTTNLVGTLQASGGITLPGGPQSFGVVTTGGASVCRDFTFTVNATCGGKITASLQLQDGTTNLGTVTYTFTIGVLNSSIQNFDAVVAPALPPGWITTQPVNISGAAPWVSSTAFSASSPNSIFSTDPGNFLDNQITSPSVAITALNAQISFQNNYNLENGFDGGVMEISIPSVAGGAFQDILTAGCSFVTGAYNGTISNSFNNPLSGRQAWTGSSSGYITTTINLPATAAGQSIQFRFRMGSDESVAGVGWRIDNIVINYGYTCSSACIPPPTVTINKAATQADPTTLSPINFTVVFSEDVTGFTTGDIDLSGTAGATTAIVSGSGNTYNVAVSGMTSSGTVIASVPVNAAISIGSIGNAASTSLDNSVIFNTSEPCLLTCPVNITINNDVDACGAIVTFPATTGTGNCGLITTTPPSGSFFPVGTTTVTSSPSILYDQSGTGSNGSPSQNFESILDDFDCQSADDFIVPAGQTWTVNQINVGGIYFNGTGPIISLNVRFYNNAGGIPGSVIQSFNDVTAFTGDPNCIITLPSAVALSAGTFWISVQANMDFLTGGQWFWSNFGTANINSEYAWQNPRGGFDICTSWGPGSTGCGVSGPEYNLNNVFTILGSTSTGSNQCNFTVTVKDTQVPTIICPANMTAITDEGTCIASIAIPDPTTNDNCGVTKLTWILTGATTGASPAAGINHLGTYFFNKGITTVTYSVSDATGNSATCSFIVTVIDKELPIIICPSNIIVSTPVGSCTVVVPYSVTATDNCSGVIFTRTAGLAEGSNFPLGVNTITHVATDASGNSTTCTFTITVLEGQPPTILTSPVNSTVCTASNVTFSMTASNAVSYQWQQLNGNTWSDISGATGSTYTMSNVDINMNTNRYRVKVFGLCSMVNSQEATLFVNPLPIITITTSQTPILLPNETVSITATTNSSGGTYVWHFNGSTISGANSSVLGPLSVDDLGTYRVIYTDNNGCVSSSADVAVIGEYNNRLWVYPNPNTGVFQVRFYNQANEKVILNVYNSTGQKIYQKSVVTSSIPYSQINIDLGIRNPPGIYIIELVNSAGKRAGAKKVIVNH